MGKLITFAEESDYIHDEIKWEKMRKNYSFRWGKWGWQWWNKMGKNCTFRWGKSW